MDDTILLVYLFLLLLALLTPCVVPILGGGGVNDNTCRVI
jgi:hypothetical protein